MNAVALHTVQALTFSASNSLQDGTDNDETYYYALGLVLALLW